MMDRLLSLFAPHYCTSCGEIGAVLCTNCKYDIVNEPYAICLACGKLCNSGARCTTCTLPYERAWCVGERTGALRALLDDYKFEHVYEASRVGSELLDSIVPEVRDVYVVPIPTIPAHIRQRGHDHAYSLARDFAKRRGLPLSRCLQRVSYYQQRGASRAQRERQAKEAFRTQGVIDGATYLIIDDIYTTGATLRHAALALRAAGAGAVRIAVIARQPSTEVD